MAAKLLEHLHNEHKNLSRFLYCFRYQLQGFGDPDQDANINLIMDMLDYINTFPERYHHPVEDVIFKKLLSKSIPDPDIITGVLAQHAKLEEITQKLKNDFNAVAMDIAMPMDQLKIDAHLYLDMQLEHLDVEESDIFPLADEYLEEDDWTELENMVETISEDPLFDNTRKEYDSLLSEITNFEAQGLDEETRSKFTDD
ncbi:hemerythrin domain-containing protein [Gynuella sp.]|uniref:hemerythrin domain-containing protein n=1 Tax=Gynuella sp. TaxID=2969146 RepID=UPI003D14EFB3